MILKYGRHRAPSRPFRILRIAMGAAKKPGLLALTLALVFCVWTSNAQAQTAYSPLKLDIPTSARYQMRANPRTGEVMVRILGGGTDLAAQVAAWNHPLLLQAVAVPRTGGEVVIRLRLRWRVSG